MQCVSLLPTRVRAACVRVVLNAEQVQTPPGAANAFQFEHAYPQNYRDVQCVGACDDLTRQLVERAGWGAA